MRSTVAGALGDLPPGSPAPEDAPRSQGVFNIITEQSSDKKSMRRLPTLFFGRAPLFVDRSVDVVAQRMRRVIDTAAEAWHRPTYLLQPCAIGGRKGLYARDILNRSPFRAKLRRLGAEFSEDSFAVLTDSDRFHCSDWGEFDPSFVITRGYDAEEPDKVIESTDALLAFRLATYRMGGIGPQELSRLVRLCGHLESAGSKSPEAVVARLTD